ncbi:hypothetical protein GCM10027049_08380 [Mucilaginibacter puniceus]
MKKILLFSLALAAFGKTYAQSLPKVQQNSVKLPANVKIDGKANEWDNKFQAYNPATELFYTIANDDKRLYLTVQGNSPVITGVANRMIGGGLTFTLINKDMKNNSGVSITFPVKTEGDAEYFDFLDHKNTGKKIITTDSVIREYNSRLERNYKFIKVSGVKNLEMVPVYNDQGIEAVGRFDMTNNYTVEISIPLELVRTQINTSNTLGYKITVNGAKSAVKADTESATGGDSKARAEIISVINKNTMMFGASTNFSGEYTLAK